MISPFACFLTAIAKVYFLEGGLGTRPSLALVEIFLTLAHSLKSEVLSRLATREATRIPTLLY